MGICASASLEALTRGFVSDPGGTARALREYANQDEEALFQAALPILREAEWTEGVRYLINLLIQRAILPKRVCDPNAFSRTESVDLLRKLMKLDPMTDLELVKSVLENGASTAEAEAAGLRLLEAMAEVSNGSRILMASAPLLRHANPRIRSKAALLVGRRSRDSKWIARIQDEPDGRVRANAIESLWGVEFDGAREVMLGASRDKHTRTAGNGMVGLYRLADLESVAIMMEGAASEDPAMRASSAWAMGETGDPRFLKCLVPLIAQTGPVGSNAFKAMGKIQRQRTASLAAEAWTVTPLHRRRLENASCEIGFTVARADGSGVVGLRPLNFVVLENGLPVARYLARDAVAPAGSGSSYELEYTATADPPPPVTLQVFSPRGWAEAVIDL